MKRMLISLGVIAVTLSTRAISAQVSLHVTTRAQSPLAEIFWALEEKANWPLTYEEPPVLAADELTTKTAPSGVPFLARRMAPMSVDFSPSNYPPPERRD